MASNIFQWILCSPFFFLLYFYRCRALSVCLSLSLLSLTLPSYFFFSPSFMICFAHQSGRTPGVIKTALPNMDREVKEQYQVLIQAKDMGGQLGGLAGTTTVNITLSDVNDNPPRFSKSECLLRCTCCSLRRGVSVFYNINYN